MTKKKLDPIDALKNPDCKIRNAAMVYLHEDRQTPFEFLSKVTGLALSTVKNYVRSKFHHLLDWARTIFQKAKNLVYRTGERFFCYIDKITMPNGEIWCKIGQTTTHPDIRARQIKSKGWAKQGCPVSVEVINVFPCKDSPSMDMMENCLRTAMTQINPEKFCKNDRLLCWEDDYPQRIIDNPFVQMGLPQFCITA